VLVLDFSPYHPKSPAGALSEARGLSKTVFNVENCVVVGGFGV
jgi:hypothetical protein